MSRYSEPICRLCRVEKTKLFLKGDKCLTDKCPVERRAYAPGQHGRSRRRILGYGLQLREKQKMKRYYGMSEKQFHLFFVRAERPEGHHRRDPAADAGAAAGQHPVHRRLRPFPGPRPPARLPRPRPGQRAPGQRSLGPGQGRRRRRLPGPLGQVRGPARPWPRPTPSKTIPSWIEVDRPELKVRDRQPADPRRRDRCPSKSTWSSSSTPSEGAGVRIGGPSQGGSMTEISFQRPKFLECDYETLTATYGKFTAQPFERGFAVTVGNALRRILLSSIPGAAITAVRIAGRAARVLDHPRGRRGRHRHPAQPEEHPAQAGRGRAQDHDPQDGRPGHGHGGRHRPRRRRRDPGHDHPHRLARQGRQAGHRDDRREQPRLHPGRPELRRDARASTTSRSTPPTRRSRRSTTGSSRPAWASGSTTRT